MKIDIEKIACNPILARMAAEHLAYSLQNITKYEQLTPRQQYIITPEMFKLIQPETHRQYYELKTKHPDHLILMCVGDFYEGRNDDAVSMAKVLGITLTRRYEEPYASFPKHQINTFLPKLVRAGFSVAICDQEEEPVRPKRLRVTELVSPSPSQ